MTDNGQLAAELAGRGLDITRPNVARIYDYFLGGKDNFAADRQAADELARLIPGSAAACHQNRQFLGRVVRYLAGEAGIRQFLDLGSGLPATSSVHEVATDIAPDARVAYVDYDPVVVLHSQVILKEKSRTTAVIKADVRDPKGIIDDPRVREVIDFTQPVAVLLFAILHFITDADKPQEILRQFTGAMVPGSYLALSHITDDDVHHERSRAAQQVYQGASAPAVPRSRGQIIQFFDGLQIIDPGLTDIRTWPGPSPHIAPSAPRLLYGGVAKRRRIARPD